MSSFYHKMVVTVLPGLAFFGMSCTQTEEVIPAASTQPHVTNPADMDPTPIPVAEIDLPNGSTIEFYDFGSAVLISEYGKAGATPSIHSAAPSPNLGKQASARDGLSSEWTRLAPNRPVPQALLDIDARFAKAAALPGSSGRTNAAGLSPITREASGIKMGPQSLVSPALGKTAAVPTGCSNGCCDYQWLSSLNACSANHFTYQWFLFNYGYTWANIDDVDLYQGLACAATGTSQFNVRMGDGKGGTWAVAEGTYRTYSWYKGWFDENLRSSVNSSTRQALHTYCGGIW